ncbi:hypothetical protein Aduo_016444 [Ancylostoma duodenale]
MRKAGCEVTFADAHKNERNEGVVCFATREDLERALDKLQGEEINGRKLKLIDDSEKRSRSRSRDRKRSRSRRSRDGSPHRSASPAGNDNGNGEAEMRSRSQTPPNDD